MDLHNSNSEWQQETPNLNAIKRENPFTAPEGYFDHLSSALAGMIKISKYTSSHREDAGFDVPPAYFDSLSDRIKTSVYADCLLSEHRSEGLSVPDSYFQSLTGAILAKTQHKPGLLKRLKQNMPAWVSYAAAASISIIVATGLIVNTHNHSLDSKLEQIPDEEIINYLKVYSDADDVPVILEGMSDEAELKDIYL